MLLEDCIQVGKLTLVNSAAHDKQLPKPNLWNYTQKKVQLKRQNYSKRYSFFIYRELIFTIPSFSKTHLFFVFYYVKLLNCPFIKYSMYTFLFNPRTVVIVHTDIRTKIRVFWVKNRVFWRKNSENHFPCVYTHTHT